MKIKLLIYEVLTKLNYKSTNFVLLILQVTSGWPKSFFFHETVRLECSRVISRSLAYLSGNTHTLSHTHTHIYVCVCVCVCVCIL